MRKLTPAKRPANGGRPLRDPSHWIFRKLTMLLVIATTLHVPVSGWSQTVQPNPTITFSGKRVTLKQVFAEIKKQTNYDVLFNPSKVDTSIIISISAKDQPLEAFLKAMLAKQPLGYRFVSTTIVIFRKGDQFSDPTGNEDAGGIPPELNVSGFIADEKSRLPLSGVNIVLNRTGKGTQTDAGGKFTLKNVLDNDSITCSFVGYQSITIPAKKTGTPLYVAMKIAVNELDVAVVQAYGITSKRLATGNITKISGDEIRRQPVMNPLLALQGRVPGMVVTPTSGFASSPVKVEIRGRNTLNENFSGEPLYVIDGIPRTVLDAKPNGLSKGYSQAGISLTGGQSILFGLNSNDIESIEVLKDGDATAIYGSRGANGVILITTKKAKPGKATLSINLNQGVTNVPRHVKMLNTQEYLAVRREAFKNDGRIPTAADAPDLMLWDTTRYTDWQKEMYKPGKATRVSAEISGGDYRNTFRISADYNTQRGLLQKTGKEEALSLSVNLNHLSQNQKLSLSMSTSYGYTFTDAISISDPAALPPNAPPVYNSKGELNFTEWGGYDNNVYPFANLKRPGVSKTNTLSNSLNISYELLNGLNLNVTAGFNSSQNNNEAYFLIASQHPLDNGLGSAYLGSTKTNNWTVGPTLNFNRFISKGKLELMAGASLQHATTSFLTTIGSGFDNDDLIESISNAKRQMSMDNFGQFKFVSVFGRISYVWENKYIVRLNGRRDGSSRFAPGKQFGNFGSVAVSWIPSEEIWMKQILPSWFSFIKLRSSYGLTGNDAIGDYEYLSQWGISLTGFTPLYAYNGVRPSVPLHPVNQQYHWESKKNFEAAVSLGFLKERINLDISFYRNVNDDQLTRQPTPEFSGFPRVVTNSAAKLENTGLEFSLNARLIETKNFRWSANFNTSINKNKLLAYPGLATSPHATWYVIGQSINTMYVFHYLGVDPLTGKYTFEDYNKDGQVTTKYNLPAGSAGDDRYVAMNLDPKFDGGFATNLSYKSVSLGLTFTFRKMLLVNPFLASPPGSMSNIYLPAKELNKFWRKPGDQAQYPRFSLSGGGDLRSSDGYYTDVSFLRLNNVYFSWSLPAKLIKKAALTTCNFSISMNNIFTITNYVGIDPNVSSLSGVPPPRIINGSLSFTF